MQDQQASLAKRKVLGSLIEGDELDDSLLGDSQGDGEFCQYWATLTLQSFARSILNLTLLIPPYKIISTCKSHYIRTDSNYT